MLRKFSRRSSSPSTMIENLEGRMLLSAVGSVEHAAKKAPSPATHTTLKVTAGALGQAITFDVMVRAAAAQGSPAGTVNILDHGASLSDVTLAPITSTNAKFAYSEATFTIPAGAGDRAYFLGAHRVSAAFTSSTTLHNSSGAATFHVKAPTYTKQSDGLKIATVGVGTGTTGIVAGQTATMAYTGYLAKNGKIFDNSDADSQAGTFDFIVEATPLEKVITGFDEGTLGMTVGETRVLAIPAKLGYGKTGSGTAIPPNANLVFLITLHGIS